MDVHQISELVELCKSLINFADIWQFFKGPCHGNQLKLQNCRFLQKDFLCRTAILQQIGISERQWAA